MRWDKCENCEETNVNRHKLSKHEGVRFPCEHCGAEFTAQGNLNKWVLAIAKTLKSQKAKILKFKRTETLPWAKICHFRTFSSCYKSFWALILYVYWSTSSFIYLLSWLWKAYIFMRNVAGTNWRSTRGWGTPVTSVVLSSQRRETSEGTNYQNMNR